MYFSTHDNIFSRIGHFLKGNAAVRGIFYGILQYFSPG